MVHIKITKGLDIPITGKPSGNVKPLISSGVASPYHTFSTIALDLRPFEGLSLRLLVKPGDAIKIGEPLAEDKNSVGRMFVSPAGGTVKEIRRGEKRALHSIVIDVATQEENHLFTPMDPSHAKREEIIERLKIGGIFASIRSRPFNLLADPNKEPRSIFVKAVESAPFVPPAELQVEGHEKEFQTGLTALSRLTKGAVHLVYAEDSTCKAFLEAKQVEKHTVSGPHPVANASLHIQKIDRILSSNDIVWTLSALDVVALGFFLMHGKIYTDRVISIAGPAIIPDRVGYFKGRAGMPVNALFSGRIQKGPIRFISGDPLMGQKVSGEEHLGFSDLVFCAIPENTKREFLHFFRLGLRKFTFSRAYLSGQVKSQDQEYDFNTNQHGERRAFIDGTPYDKVMPLEVPTMLLVKAVLAQDFDLAEEYGLLEVDAEDFALPTFVCPSKIEMTDIVKNGLKAYAKEVVA